MIHRMRAEGTHTTGRYGMAISPFLSTGNISFAMLLSLGLNHCRPLRRLKHLHFPGTGMSFPMLWRSTREVIMAMPR